MTLNILTVVLYCVDILLFSLCIAAFIKQVL